MKQILFLLCIGLLFMNACSNKQANVPYIDEQVSGQGIQDQEIRDIVVRLQAGRKEEVMKCNDLATIDEQRVCYAAYVTSQIQTNQKTDPAICQKITDQKLMQLCREQSY